MKTRTYIIIILVLLLILLVGGWYIGRIISDNNSLKSTINYNEQKHNDKTEYFTNKLGTQTATIKNLKINAKTLKKELLSKDDSLKTLAKKFSKVKGIIKWKTKIEIDSIPVPFIDSIPCNFEKFGRYADNISFDWKFTNKGFGLYGLKLENEPTLITGFKRKWFLGRPTLYTDLTGDNPLFKTSKLRSIEVVVPKPFYDTRVFNIALGFVGGYFMAK